MLFHCVVYLCYVMLFFAVLKERYQVGKFIKLSSRTQSGTPEFPQEPRDTLGLSKLLPISWIPGDPQNSLGTQEPPWDHQYSSECDA